VAFLTTVPAEALLGRASAVWALGSLAAAAISLVGTRQFWQFAHHIGRGLADGLRFFNLRELSPRLVQLEADV
jgi:hypothetical protein